MTRTLCTQPFRGHFKHYPCILAIFSVLFICCDSFFSKKNPLPNAVKRPQKGIYVVKKIKINTDKISNK